MNYKDLVANSRLREILATIDNNNDNQMNHGFQHTVNVVENIEKLGHLLKLDNKTLEHLKIAGYLHDIGQIATTTNHSLEGSKMAMNYLSEEMDKKDYNKILSAIKHHHEKEKIKELPLFEHIILFADKMDFTYKRLDKNYCKRHPEIDYVEKYVLEVNFEIEKTKFIVLIKSQDKEAINKIEAWEYYPKIKKRIAEFANKLNKEYQIRIYS